MFDKRMNDLRREIQNKASAELPPDANDPVVVEFTSSNGFPRTAILVLHGAGGEDAAAQASWMKKISILDGGPGDAAGGRSAVPRRFRSRPGRRPGCRRCRSPTAWRLGSAQHPPGRVRVQDREWLVRMEGKTPDPEALAQAAVVAPAGRVALDEAAGVARATSVRASW